LAIDAGRLLVLSPFSDRVRRPTARYAHARNEFVAALAAAVLMPHASPGGKADALAKQILRRRRSLFTFENTENKRLLDLGARPYSAVCVRDPV
jgi:predicted Rossmann fold nucleotide-binding protein DprA/Smf involved in DNA uptake